MYKGFLAVSLLLAIGSLVIGIVSLVHPDWLKYCFVRSANSDEIALLNAELHPDYQLEVTGESACIRRGLIQIAGGVNEVTDDRVLIIPYQFLTTQEKETIALIVVGLFLLLPALISVMVGICCPCGGKKGKQNASLVGLIFFLIAGIVLFSGSIVYTAKQANLQPYEFFQNYESIINSINNPAVPDSNSIGRNMQNEDDLLDTEDFPGLTNLLGNFNYPDGGSDSDANEFFNLFGGSDNPFAAIFGGNGSISLGNEAATTSPSTTTTTLSNSIVDLQSHEGFSGDILGGFENIDIQISGDVIDEEEEISIPENLIPESSITETPSNQNNNYPPDLDFLEDATLHFGTSYILGWVCGFIAVLAALMAIIAKSQAEDDKEKEEEFVTDDDSEKKEDFNA